MRSSSAQVTHRPEIDGLRGIAVVAVILNHYFEGFLTAGFLGVDVFYVISGYVITGYLTRTSANSWREYLEVFYSRRVKRLLPALLACVVFTGAIFLVVAPNPSMEIFKTGQLALLGFSNVYLFFSSSDYFSLNAKLNPYTQTWSLGVEEQFYLVFPIILGALGLGGGQRPFHANALKLIIGMTSVSLGLYVITSFISPSAAFYLMPMRFWELSAGAIAFLSRANERPAQVAGVSSLYFVFLLCAFTLPPKFQVVATILCVFLTAGLLRERLEGSIVYGILSGRLLTYLGLISYSLYLWHWSVLVLGRWTVGEDLITKSSMLLIALAASLISYYLIEKPMRYAAWGVRSSRFAGAPILYGLMAVLVAVVGSSWVTKNYLLNKDAIMTSLYGVPSVPDWGKSVECHGSFQISKYENPYEHCLGGPRSDDKPSVLFLIGDSHAAQFVFMAKDALDNSRYALKFINTENSQDFPLGFMNSNRRESKIFEYIIEHAKPRDVVMISFHRGHLNEVRDEHIPLSRSIIVSEQGENFYINADRYFRKLAGKGVEIILVKDTPLMGAQVASATCLLQIKLFGHSKCKVKLEQDLHTRKRQDLLFDKLRKNFSNVYTWDPLPYIYGSRFDLDVVDESGEYVMMDWNHITSYESVRLSEYFQPLFLSVSNHR